MLVAVVVALRIDALKSAIFKGARMDLYLNAALVFVLVFFVIRLLDGLWRAWFVKRQREFPVPKVLHTILLAVLYLAAFFIVIKGVLGINISAFLATSALLTAILGLAFQGVLSNLLSGISLHFTKSFAKGDWVGVGEERRDRDRYQLGKGRLGSLTGFPISWFFQTTPWLREKITNFSRPQKKTALIIPVKVSYSAPPSLVFEALRQAALDVPDVASQTLNLRCICSAMRILGCLTL